MTDITDKIQQLFDVTAEISEIDEGVGQIFQDHLSIALSTLQQVVENGGTIEVDASEQIRLVSEILGFSLEEMILHVMNSKDEESINNKDPDQDTLDFITQQSDIDDYERFLAENKVKDNLNFLIKEL